MHGFDDPESANGYYRFPSGGDSSNIVEQLNEEENGTEIKLLEWNATAAVNLLPLFNPNNPNMVLKSQVTVSQYQVDKFNGWFIPSTYGPNVNPSEEKSQFSAPIPELTP